MQPFDAKAVQSEARESEAEAGEPELPDKLVSEYEGPDEEFSPLARKPKLHTDARFTVSNPCGEVQAWTVKEAVRLAFRTPGRWVEVHERGRFLVRFRPWKS